MKKDFENYLLQVQRQKTKMDKAVKDANQALVEGKMSNEQVQSISMAAANLNANYQRLLYCRYLYRLPPKFIQKLRLKSAQRKAKKMLEELAAEKADEESVITENEDNLNTVEEIVGEVNGRTD